MNIENMNVLDNIMENAGLIGGKQRTIKKVAPKKKSKGSKKIIKKSSKKLSKKVVKKTSKKTSKKKRGKK